MTTPPDSTLATRFRGTSFRRSVKAIVKTLVVLLVVGGIGRSLQLAWTDIHNTENKIANRIAEIDRLLENSSDPLQRSALEQERASATKSRMDWKNVRFSWIPGSVVAGFFAIMMPGILWWQVLRTLHFSPPFIATQSAYSVGSLGKYVPGKAMVLVLRSTAMRRWGTPVAASVTATIVETLISLSAAGTVGAVTLWGSFSETISPSSPPPWLLQVSIASALLSVIPIIPPVFNRLLVLVAKRKKLHDTAMLPRIGWRDMIHCWLLSAVGWGLMGVSLFAAVACVSPVAFSLENTDGIYATLHLLTLSTATATLAFVIGFLSMLPGGAGVRELVVTLILAPVVGYAPALAAAVLYRLCSLASELSMAGLTSFAPGHAKPHLD